MPLSSYAQAGSTLDRVGHLLFRISRVLFVAAVLPWASASYSQDADPSIFSFSGFGTLGVVHSSEEDADFVATTLQPTGAGYTRDWAFDVDSRIGAQVTATFTPRFSAVVQVISEQRYDDTFKPTVEWANLKYEILPGLNLRVGRIITPSFMASEYRKVGFALPWVRPPVEVYNLVAATNSDGVDLSYRRQFGQIENTLQFSYGARDEKLPDGNTAEARNYWGVTNTAEIGDLTLRAAYQQSKISLESYERLLGPFRLFGPQGVAIAEELDPDGELFRFVGLGVNYDPGKWFLMAEWGRTRTDSIIGKREAWYVSGGYRIGRFTPYAVYARTRIRSDSSHPGLPGVDPLNDALNDVLAGRPDQKTISVGLRWDFAEKAAFKLQYDHSSLGGESNGTLTNFGPGFRGGGSFNVFSATVDFIF